MSPSHTLFLGTFIQLPKTPVDGKHALDITTGALWTSTTDGRIKGFDWAVRPDSDEDVRALMQRNGWVGVVEGANGVNGHQNGDVQQVKVVRAVEERNEFFFPGFIGTLLFLVWLVTAADE